MELTCPVLSTSQGQGTMDQGKDGMYTVSAGTNSQTFKYLHYAKKPTVHLVGVWAIIKVSGHWHWWLAGGYDLEIGHF